MSGPSAREANAASDAELPAPKRARLGRYELLARIAAGGMAEVYVARVSGEGGFERLVAVKRMLASIASDEKFAEMFLDEGRISGHIESPHVVQVHDVGRAADGTLFIAMELVRGVALHHLVGPVLRAGKMVPVPIAVALIAQAAEGLGAAHDATTPLGERLEVVHRDVSPQNILVGIDGRARVADFGIARAVHRRTNTATGELKGKLAYFAPEQLRARPADARSDVFSLAVVAWETIAGRRLFQGEHPFQTVEQIRVHEPEPLDTIRADVPHAVAVAIARALVKDPDRRTGSAHAFAEELRAAAAPAGASVVAAFVREWAGDSVRALDDRIRAALGGASDSATVTPATGDETSGVVAAGETNAPVTALVPGPPANVAPPASVTRPLVTPPILVPPSLDSTEAPVTVRLAPRTDAAKTALAPPRPTASLPDGPSAHAAAPAIEEPTRPLRPPQPASAPADAGAARRAWLGIAIAAALLLVVGVVAYASLDAAPPASTVGRTIVAPGPTASATAPERSVQEVSAPPIEVPVEAPHRPARLHAAPLPGVADAVAPRGGPVPARAEPELAEARPAVEPEPVRAEPEPERAEPERAEPESVHAEPEAARPRREAEPEPELAHVADPVETREPARRGLRGADEFRRAIGGQ